MCQDTIGGEGEDNLSLTLLNKVEGRLGDTLKGGGGGLEGTEVVIGRKSGDSVALGVSWLQAGCLPGEGIFMDGLRGRLSGNCLDGGRMLGEWIEGGGMESD